MAKSWTVRYSEALWSLVYPLWSTGADKQKAISVMKNYFLDHHVPKTNWPYKSFLRAKKEILNKLYPGE